MTFLIDRMNIRCVGQVRLGKSSYLQLQIFGYIYQSVFFTALQNVGSKNYKWFYNVNATQRQFLCVIVMTDKYYCPIGSRMTVSLNLSSD